MPTTVNRDNYDQVEFEMAPAAPDSCLTQAQRTEIERGLSGWISKLRNTLSGLLRAADQSDNLTTITYDLAILTPEVKQWEETQQVAAAAGADVDVTFTEFADVGIDGESALLVPWVAADDPDYYEKLHLKSRTADEVVYTLTNVSGDCEVFLRALEFPTAGNKAIKNEA